MKVKNHTHGFTLLELLLVIGIVVTVMAAMWSPISRYIAQTRVKEAAEQFARDVQGQHFEAKRRNATRTVQVVASSNTYRVGTTDYSLPAGVRFTAASSGTVTFYGPYGTTIATNGVVGPNLQTFTLAAIQNSSVTRSVTVVGLIGKVIIK